MEERGTPAGLRQALREMRRERGRVAPGERKTHVLGSPKTPTIYRGRGEGPAPSRSHLEGRGGGQEGETCPPSKVEAPPPLGFPTLGAEGGPGVGAPAH